MSKPYLPFPPAALDQHLIALGKTRSGKSSKLRVIIEYVLDLHTAPVTIIDFKGDWWGLKSDADGKHAGYPIVIFGGKHADVPLNPRAGKAVAELLSGGNRSAILDLKGWAPSDKVRFYIDFISRTFQLQDGGKRYIAIPEAHNVAPKGRVLSPQVGEMLHWTSALAAEGQGMGLILLLDSQRGQKVHNDVLSACETLIACRVIHAADRGAIKEWIDGNGDPKIGQSMLAELANMPRTDAYVWSPECDFGPERITWQMFRTFDSFKPQQPNQKKPKGWADVDLQEVESKLASVIEEQKANDPAELRREIAALKKQLSATPGKNRVSTGLKPAAADLKAAEASGFSRGRESGIAAALKAVGAQRKSLAAALHRAITATVSEFDAVGEDLKLPAAPVVWSQPSAKPAPVIQKSFTPAIPLEPLGNDGSIGGGKRRVMIALAQNPNGLTKRKLGILSNIRPAASTWRGIMAQLRRDQLIEDDGETFRLTESGTAALGEYTPLPTGEALIDYWRGQLGGGSRLAIFNAIVESYPDAISAQRISEITGIDIGGSTWRGHMAKLRGLELVSGSAELVANEDLFS